MTTRALVLLLLLVGCRERKQPERGVALVFTTQPGAREVFERRLARLHQKAHLAEDKEHLVVRLSEGADVERAKRLLLVRGRLELCPEDDEASKLVCERKSDDVVHEGASCFVTGPERGAVRAAAEGQVQDKARVVLQAADGRYRSFAVPRECLAPSLLDGTWKKSSDLGLVLALTLDAGGSRELEKLSATLLKRRLVVMVDEVVQSAPLVSEAIPGGRLEVVGLASDADAELLVAALVGGPLEKGVQFVEERSWGPPRL